MNNALLEVGIEHLPARFLQPALEQLAEKVASALKERRLEFRAVSTCGTMRRLAVIIEGVAERSPDMEKEVSGPPWRLLKNDKGEFTPQSAGFARSNGIKPEELVKINSPKGELMSAKKVIKGETAQAILCDVLPAAVASLQFPKNMIWEPGRFRFARPLRCMAALYGTEVLSFELAGVKTGNSTPQALMHGKKWIEIKSADSYVEILRSAGILVSAKEREESLRKQLAAEAAKLGVEPDLDAALIAETVNMTEFPVVVVGNFNDKFLMLPRDFITTVFKKQLKFFPLYKKDGGVASNFIAVRDGSGANQDEVRQGFESVLEARFSDAVFFFENDLKKPLEDMREKLRDALFHEKLGTIYQKSARVESLASWICGELRQEIPLDEHGVREAARLAYADLTSDVVREFPELQGYMGGVYADRAGKVTKVAMAIREFYYPSSTTSPLPLTLESAVVSLAGKMDTLAGDFSAGVIPTGSEDPHGLRRQAFGAVRILLEKNIPLSVRALASRALELCAADYTDKAGFDKAGVLAQIEEFVWQRAENVFAEKGLRFDEVRAVKKFAAGASARPLVEVFQRVQALHNVRKNPDFESIAGSYKRVSNILKQAEGAQDGVDEKLLGQNDAEASLYSQLRKVRATVEPSLSGLSGHPLAQEDFEGALRNMVGLKPYVDAFFDKVMVMDKDPNIKRNRIALVSDMHRLLGTVADLSQLQ